LAEIKPYPVRFPDATTIK